MIVHGDCIEAMAGMDSESVDAIVTDPPYGLGFMGKAWDDAARLASVPPSAKVKAMPYPATGKGPGAVAFDGRAFQSWCGQWAEAAYRVAKPSAYLLAFGGTRTVHRMTVALEDAGWIIRDMLVWAYASGFPKSKASLKPAWEPIVMARKPGPLRMLAIDECRLAPGEGIERDGEATASTVYDGPIRGGSALGRWPANVILTDPVFDGGWDGVVGGGYQESTSVPGAWAPRGAFPIDNPTPTIYGDYSRFFLIPKAARSDREPVLGGPTSGTRGYGNGKGVKTRQCRRCGDRTQSSAPPYQPACGHGDWEWQDALPIARANVHPTVKPVDLMRHLVRLVTPTGGTVLDPFLGSGTTALAAELEGFPWVGIEREAEYVAIAEARLNGTQKGLGI